MNQELQKIIQNSYGSQQDVNLYSSINTNNMIKVYIQHDSFFNMPPMKSALANSFLLLQVIFIKMI